MKRIVLMLAVAALLVVALSVPAFAGKLGGAEQGGRTLTATLTGAQLVSLAATLTAAASLT